jgi:hypothetical protein
VTFLLAAVFSLGLFLGPFFTAYSPSVTGRVVGFRLAGIEPDGDPLDQVVLRTRLSPSGGLPAANLIVDTYLENFKPDTTPILPNLLHPGQTATNLGGFLQGKVLLTDDAGDVLYIGSFVAEAFLDNSNDAVMRLYGSGAAYGASGSLKGRFRLRRKDASLYGHFTGHITLPAAARQQLLQRRGARMKPIDQIIKVVTVTPHAMVGRTTTKSSSVPLQTGYGQPKPAPSQPAGRRLSPWTVVAGAGAVVSFLLAGLLYWRQRRTVQRAA